VDRYKVTVNVYQDDEPTDRLGRAYLKAGDETLTMSQVQQGQYELLGYGSDTSYEVWFGNNNSGKTVSFSASGNSAEIRYYTVVIKTKVDGSEADVDSVEMRAVGSDEVIRPVKSNKGIYQVTSLGADTMYQVYVNGEDTGKTVGFSTGNTIAALDFYTVTYASESALGSVPQDGKLYLAGRKATILPQGNLHKSDGEAGVTYSFAGWSGSDGNNYTSGQQAVISSKLVLTAQWSASEEAEASWRISGQTATYYGSLAEAIAVAEATGPAVSITLRKTATLSDFEGTLGISDKLTLESGADLKLVNTTITNLGIINNGSATITSSTGSVLYSKGSISSADHTATENGGSIQVLVTFDANGYGTAPESGYVELKSNISASLKPADIPANRVFDGWARDDEGENLWNCDTDIVTDSMTLFATWSPFTVTVTYDGNGHGEKIPEAVVAEPGTKLEQPTQPTEKGYTFGGWYKSTAASSNDKWNFDNDTVGAEGFTLYAKWIPNEYTVIFDNQGHGIAPEPVDAAYGTTIAEPTAPTETGYTFNGWFEDPDGFNEWDFENSVIPAENVTLYANWSVNQYKVEFDANGLGYDDFAAKAASMGGRMNSPFTARVDYGTRITEPDFDPTTAGIQKPTEPGYDFLGWYADEEGTTPWNFDSNTMPAENIMIYGLWEAKDYKVTFDDNGGTGGSEGRELTVTFATSPEAVTVPTRSGYTFMGYYASEDNGLTFKKQYYSYDGKPVGTWDIPSDTTLYAKWMAGEANVFFDMQGHGDTAIAPLILAEGDLIAEPEKPFEDKSIYVFDGWYTDESFETKWNFATDTVPQGGITLYAKWKSDYADVTFNNNGVGVAPANMMVKIGDHVLFEGAPMSSVEPVLLEEEQGFFSFEGWYTSAACTDDTAWDVAATPVPESGVKLYAKWQRLDQSNPVISGVTEGKTYCGAVAFKVTDDNLKLVTVNGTEVILDSEGSYTIPAGIGQAVIKATDKSKNTVTMTVTVNSDHDWKETSYEWSEDKTQVTATRICKTDESHVETETVNTTNEVTREAACETDGERIYTATFSNAAFAVQTKTVTIDKLGHDWSGAWTVKKEATATEEGKEETFCTRGCGCKKVRTIPALGSTEASDTGTLEKDAEVSAAAPIESASLDNLKSELLDAPNIFAPEERTAIQNGEDARVWMEVNSTDESRISQEDKQTIQNAAAAVMGDNPTITYFDIELFKQVGDNEKTQLHEPGIPIQVTIQIPADLLNHDVNLIREYKIIRLHTDVSTGESLVDTLSGIFDEATGDFTFETDKFSTYAIAYKDVPVVLDTGDDSDQVTTEDGGNTDTSDGTVTISSNHDTSKHDDNNNGENNGENNGDNNGDQNGNNNFSNQEGTNNGTENGNKNTGNQDGNNNGENNANNNNDNDGNDANVQDDDNENNTSESDTDTESDTESENNSSTGQDDTDSIDSTDQENCFWHWIILAVSIIGSIIAFALGKKRKKQALLVLAAATAIDLLFIVLGTCYLDLIFAIAGILIMLIIAGFLYGDNGKDNQGETAK
ncbi:MAG: InlB B-repeat-containing protein, partial [Agathobacter sp.]|nr:InlB B-repeat-containing protein [Agathobacter sp.]